MLAILIFSATCVFILSASKKPEGSDLTDVSLHHVLNSMYYNAGKQLSNSNPNRTTTSGSGKASCFQHVSVAVIFFSLSPDICQERDDNRLHLPGAGSAAARLSDVSLGELHGPRCSVSAAERRATA